MNLQQLMGQFAATIRRLATISFARVQAGSAGIRDLRIFAIAEIRSMIVFGSVPNSTDEKLDISGQQQNPYWMCFSI